jgi:Fe-coproporphyrin III synthase
MEILQNARNSWRQAAAAFRFRKFSGKLLDIRCAESLSRLLVPLSGGKPLRRPRSVVVRITERCFLRCRMCGQNGEKGRLRGIRPSERAVFDGQVLERVIEEIGRWPIKPFLKITGGEPLVEREMTISALERASRLKLVTKLNTNGVLLADERIARRVAGSGLSYLSVSIDGPPDVHDRIRGREGVYGAALEGIRHVRRYGKEHSQRPLMILVSAVISTMNQDRLLELSRLLEAEKIDWLNFEFMNFVSPEMAAEAEEALSAHFGISESPWDSFVQPEMSDIDPGLVAGQIRAVRKEGLSIPVSFLNIGDLSVRNIARYVRAGEAELKTSLCAMPYATAFLVPPSRMVFCIDYPFDVYADLAGVSVAEGWRGKRADEFRRGLAAYYRGEKKNLPQCRRCNWRFN